MKINPQDISWQAPTTNTDGSVITEPLSYTLGVYDGANFVEQLSFPGSLNADGSYTAPVSGLNLAGGLSAIALLAFYVSQPELKSDWSNPIDILIGAVPDAPFGLAAA